MDFFSEYFSSIAVVAAVSGIICALGENVGGMGKFICCACSLAVIYSILYPIGNIFNDDKFDITNFTYPEITYNYSDAKNYYDSLARLTEEKLSEYAMADISSRFNLGDEDTEVIFHGIFGECFALERATVVIKSFKSLVIRNEIVEYIESTYKCDCEVTENIYG